MGCFAMGNHEIGQIPTAMTILNAYDKIVIVLTCLVGVGIAYSGVWLQSLISATSFLVLATGNKFAIILIEFFLSSRSVLMSQVVGATIVIVCGVFYGRAREQAEEAWETAVQQRSHGGLAKETEPLIKKSSEPRAE